MKKFTEGVRCKLEIIGTCAIMLVSSIVSANTLKGNDDKAKKKEVKLVNTFVETDNSVKELSEDFNKISKAVDRYMSVYGTYTSTDTTTITTLSTTSTTVLTTTTVSATTVITTATETTNSIEVTETEEINEEFEEIAEEYEADTNEYEESNNSESECDENNCNDECVEAAVEVAQPSGDITDYISESDYILLCNAVGHEYGSNWVSIQDKALVVEVIMNRVNSASFPSTIYGVLTQPYQFSGAWSYVNLGCFSYQVTQSVKDSVLYYFQHPDEFTHGYLSFNGDGYRNYFR